MFTSSYKKRIKCVVNSLFCHIFVVEISVVLNIYYVEEHEKMTVRLEVV